VRNGLIKESDIDEHVLRLLTARFRLGEMDQDVPNEWDEIPYSVISSDEHSALALQMAHESMVLLQNKNDLLPLKSDMKIAVIGANANDSTMQWGNYNGFPKHTETLVSALKKRIPAQNLTVIDGGSLVLDYYYASLFDQCSTANGNGLDATYYGNKEYQGDPIATTRYTTPLDLHTQGATTFAQGVPLTDFSVSYKTTLHNKQAGKVGFQIKMTGHYDLIINGDTVSSQDARLRGDDPVYEMDAVAGKDYDIELRYNFISTTADLSFDIVRKHNYDTNALISQVRSADVVIYAGGISPRLEGEEMPVTVEGFKGGDRTDIQLPKVQREFLKKLKAAGKRVVFVNYSGSAVGLVPEKQSCDAILQAWYPGQEGGTAIVDVLLGDYNPSGRLPVTFYTDTLQIPDFQEYSMKGRTYRYMEAKPAFAFGYGLSYTTFEYGKAEVKNGALVVDVKNTGKRDGEEVVQLYIKRPGDADGPIKTLRGFQRVSIPAGASITVSIPLTDETFQWWDTQSNTVRPLKGEYTLFVGNSSDDPKMQALPYTF
jgi:beta-glucosidase